MARCPWTLREPWAPIFKAGDSEGRSKDVNSYSKENWKPHKQWDSHWGEAAAQSLTTASVSRAVLTKWKSPPLQELLKPGVLHTSAEWISFTSCRFGQFFWATSSCWLDKGTWTMPSSRPCFSFFPCFLFLSFVLASFKCSWLSLDKQAVDHT